MAPKKARKRSEIRYICDDPQYQYYPPELRDLYCTPIATLEDSEDLEEE